MSAGRVIVLNGTSSSGKTSLAKALQPKLVATGACWIVTGVDDFFAKLPREWLDIGNHHGVHGADGCVFEVTDGVFEMRMGPVGQQLLSGYRGSVAALARAGINVIVDDVTLQQWEWDDWQAQLDGLDVLWVQLKMDLEVLEARELARPDRVVGMARWQYPLAYRYPTVDVAVDTGVRSPEEAADLVIAALG